MAKWQKYALVAPPQLQQRLCRDEVKHEVYFDVSWFGKHLRLVKGSGETVRLKAEKKR